MKEKTYHIGKRMIVFRNIFFAAGTMVIIVFYFVYDFLFTTSMPWIKGVPLLAVFLLLEAVMIYLSKSYVDRVIAGTEYRLTKHSLEVRLGSNSQSFPYKDFSRAFYGQVDFTGACPVTYIVNGRQYRPSAYLEDVWGMHQELIERIRPYAEIEEGLESKISAFAR